jgi:hypothetical protein
MRSPAVAIAILGALPALLLVTWSSSRTISQFWDPCFQWGISHRGSMHISPGGPCRAMGGTSETKAQAVVRLTLVHGGILIASLLAILGALLSRPLLSVLGAGLIFFEAIPLIWSFAWLTVFVSGLFLLAARKSAPVHGAAKMGTRVIGSVGGLAALVYMRSLLEGPPLFFVFLVIALVFVAVVGWWPVRMVREEMTNSAQ